MLNSDYKDISQSLADEKTTRNPSGIAVVCPTGMCGLPRPHYPKKKHVFRVVFSRLILKKG